MSWVPPQGRQNRTEQMTSTFPAPLRYPEDVLLINKAFAAVNLLGLANLVPQCDDLAKRLNAALVPAPRAATSGGPAPSEQGSLRSPPEAAPRPGASGVMHQPHANPGHPVAPWDPVGKVRRMPDDATTIKAPPPPAPAPGPQVVELGPTTLEQVTRGFLGVAGSTNEGTEHADARLLSRRGATVRAAVLSYAGAYAAVTQGDPTPSNPLFTPAVIIESAKVFVQALVDAGLVEA